MNGKNNFFGKGMLEEVYFIFIGSIFGVAFQFDNYNSISHILSETGML